MNCDAYRSAQEKITASSAWKAQTLARMREEAEKAPKQPASLRRFRPVLLAAAAVALTVTFCYTAFLRAPFYAGGTVVSSAAAADAAAKEAIIPELAAGAPTPQDAGEIQFSTEGAAADTAFGADTAFAADTAFGEEEALAVLQAGDAWRDGAQGGYDPDGMEVISIEQGEALCDGALVPAYVFTVTLQNENGKTTLAVPVQN